MCHTLRLRSDRTDTSLRGVQPVPLYTTDTLAHQQSTLTALEEAPGGRERASRMQAQVLLSDMASFKAANPGSVLEDFVRWHSPKDWIVDDNVGLIFGTVNHKVTLCLSLYFSTGETISGGL